MTMHHLFFVILLTVSPFASAAAPRPVPQIKRALIISVDGLRPDVLLRADAPRIRGMVDSGSFTFWARSTVYSLTLPTHVSLLTGVIPEAHGIVWNGDLPLTQPIYSRVPTLFELAGKAGYSTACITGKGKFDVVDKPGTIDFTYFPDESKTDAKTVTVKAMEVLKQHRPDVTFVHLPDVDVVGHANGWGSPEQLAAIHDVDACVGQILDTLAELKLADETVVILTADHGGAGRQHGSEDFRSRHIPWIITGPGIRKNYDLTNNRDLSVEVYDTFSVVTKLLAIPVAKKVNGKFIDDILAERELMQADAPQSAPRKPPATQAASSL